MSRVSTTLIGICTIFLGSAPAAQLITNGNFNAGLSGWSIFTTSNGTLGQGLPDIAQYPPDTSLNAAHVHEGQATYNPSSGEQGGGIYQTVNTTSGSMTLSVDLAAVGGSLDNLYGGFAQLLIDFQPVAGYDFGALQAGQTKTTTLSVAELMTAGSHTIGIQFLRPATVDAATPYQFVTDFSASEGGNPFFSVQAPEPRTTLVLALLLAFAMWRKWGPRFRLLSSKAKS